jgi:hypothetical protein
MPDSPTSGAESAFVCDCDERMRKACAGEPFYGELKDKRFCVLHFPSKEKSADFEPALQKKLEKEDFNFRGVWFPDQLSFEDYEFRTKADFSAATFSAGAYFSNATFSAGAYFSNATFRTVAYFHRVTFRAEAYFSYAKFRGSARFNSATFSAKVDSSYAAFSALADFSDATFTAVADFNNAIFGAKADFSDATFTADACFNYATFSATANFIFATFSKLLNLWRVTFKDYVMFAGSAERTVFGCNSSVDLQFATIERAERVSLHSVSLHPHWFINVDARRFDFINIHWNNYGKAKPELELLKHRNVPSRHTLLVVACRKLAANCEENDRFRSASQFRRMAMDAERFETWRGFDFRRLNWWYWLASGYGERPLQALFVLIGILLIFGTLYTRVGFARWEPKVASEAEAEIAKRDEVGAPLLPKKRAFTYSLSVMTLQKPEPRPATMVAQTVVLLETILGPLQAALLALAIRRKFMR